MGLLREKALRSAGIVTLIVGLLVSPLSLQAQDNSQGRYRPEGRQVGLAIGREFDERLSKYEPMNPMSAPRHSLGRWSSIH